MNLEKSPDGLNITNSTGSGKAEALNDGLHRMSEAGLEFHVIDVAEELAAMQGQSTQSEKQLGCSLIKKWQESNLNLCFPAVFLVRPRGLEPRTSRLKAGCSAN